MMPVISSLLFIALLIQAGTTALGIDAFRQGRFEEARRSLEKSLASNPQDGAARAFLAMTKAGLHDCAAAVSEFTSNADATMARMSGLAAVECDSATNRGADGLALLEKLTARFPSDPDVLYESAKLHRKAWDLAVASLYTNTPSSYRVNQLSGEIFETQGKYAEAATQYSKAIEKAPEALNLHYRLGRCLLLGSPPNYDTARKEFEAELKLSPTDALAEFQIGLITLNQQQRQDAIEHFEHAIKLSPSFTEALIELGRIQASDKRYDEAAKLFEKAVSTQPENEAAHYNLMLAYRNSGRGADALQQKKELDRLQKPPEGEFTEFLKKLGDQPPTK